jgi:hypothetical protein
VAGYSTSPLEKVENREHAYHYGYNDISLKMYKRVFWDCYAAADL